MSKSTKKAAKLAKEAARAIDNLMDHYQSMSEDSPSEYNRVGACLAHYLGIDAVKMDPTHAYWLEVDTDKVTREISKMARNFTNVAFSIKEEEKHNED